jgi:hypothetical protein
MAVCTYTCILSVVTKGVLKVTTRSFGPTECLRIKVSELTASMENTKYQDTYCNCYI